VDGAVDGTVEYRVEQLAAACDLSVDTVRYYQSKGLLSAPEKRGRVAIYGPEHAARLRQIRALQDRGLTLAVIKRALDGDLGRGDTDLAAAVAAAKGSEDPSDRAYSLEDVAEQTGVPTALLRAIQKAGLRIGRAIDGRERYGPADVAVVRQGLRLLEAGFPLNELLDIGKRYDVAARAVAEHAVDLFNTHVREPIQSSAGSDEEASARLVDAFERLLPAVTAIVAHHFRHVLLELAEERVTS
jgi:DNA-binding transcriptional MerR regulator